MGFNIYDGELVVACFWVRMHWLRRTGSGHYWWGVPPGFKKGFAVLGDLVLVAVTSFKTST